MSETSRKINEWFVWGRVKIVFKMKAKLSNKITHIALAGPSTCAIAVLRDRFFQYISLEITHFRIAFLPSLSPVPQKVLELQAGPSGWLQSLRVTWVPPAGDWERYHLLLWNHSALVLNTTLEKDTTEYLIRDVGLIPGREYGVEVIVESGDLQSKTSCMGRTGQHACQAL